MSLFYLIFLPIVVCCLLCNLLRIEDDASIEHLMCIIELEADSLHEDQPINIAQDEPTNQHLDGKERFKKKLWRQLTHYISTQRSIYHIKCCNILFFSHLNHFYFVP